MEYFDFDQAAHHEGHLPCENLNPSSVEIVDDNDYLLQLGDDYLSFSQPGFAPTGFDDFQSWAPSLTRPELPCNNCQRSKLDCLIVYEGQYSCSSCVALSKTCSFAIPEEDEELGGALNDLLSDLLEGTGLRGVSEEGAMESLNKPRKSGTRFPRVAVNILKTWLADHKNHPYPNDKEKDELKKQTGLKRSQVSNWLANARRRGKARSSDRTSPRPTGPGQPYLPSPGIAIPGAVDRTALKDMDPLERWKHSPPENEPASVTDIANALAKSRYRGDREPSMAFDPQRSESSAGSSFSVFRAPSMASLEPGRSSGGSDLSLSSVYSHQSRQSSRHSFGSFPMVEKKERRRRRRPAPVKQTEPDSKRIFQCTFCTDCFKTKHDWQRHEKSLHLPLESWTCAKYGAVIVTPTAIRCAYCNMENLKSGHLETHNFQQCMEKSISERTFYRKDHLRQHLRLAHGCSFVGQMETWKEGVVDLKSRCGFCDAKFTTWQMRVDHIAIHFRAGMQISEWKGDWGFEQKIQDTVENAVPPWMIDHERKSVEPFSASKSVNTTERLEKDLVSWIEDQKTLGIQISDAMIQNQARLIVHGTDNPWNQTAADTPGWLDYIKHKTGLLTEDSSGGSGSGGLFSIENASCFNDKWAGILPPQSGVCYQVLERQLVEWIGDQISRGIIPSDTMIQDQARVAIYSSDDPWNQTAADNSQWLDMVKRKQGWIDKSGNWILPTLGEL